MHVKQLPYEKENQVLEEAQTVLMVSDDAKKFLKQSEYLIEKAKLVFKILF